jgi:hypothetical protein
MGGRICMNFKGKGEISTQRLCKKDMENADPVIEESLIIQFNADNYAELTGITNEEMKSFFKKNENKGFEKDKGSFILSNVFNLKLDNRHEFTGEKFTSCVIKKIDKTSPVIRLHCRLKFTENFHRDLPTLLNTVIDIEIKSVNEQMEIPEGDECRE